MSTYIVKWTTDGQAGGKPSITVPPKTFNDTATSLVLTGKGLNNYGLFQQENFIRLLENFASPENANSPSAPIRDISGRLTIHAGTPNPTIGQSWYNMTQNIEYYWDGQHWDNVILRSSAGPNPPQNPVVGRLWYDTLSCGLKVYDCTGNWVTVGTGGGGGNNIIAGLGQYMGDDGEGGFGGGFAERINIIIGSPSTSGSGEHFGWGQLDYVPTYQSNDSLDITSQNREADLPNGEIFPGTFNNSAWAIALSRLRKALRQVGISEDRIQSVGFMNDGSPSGSGNNLANIYNNFDAGPTPFAGQESNILAGFGSFTEGQIFDFYQDAEAALNLLQEYRFSLGPAQTQIQALITRSRTAPPVSMNIPASEPSYVHSIEVQFPDYAAAAAYFNSGGQFQFNMDFTPSATTPSNVENDWANFMNDFTGFCFDYQGIKKTAAYANPDPLFQPEYMSNGNTADLESIGFYELTNANQIIFKRDVLDAPSNNNLYRSTAPTNGGVIIRARTEFAASGFKIHFDITYLLRNVTTGTPAQNDTTDTQLTGTLVSNLNAIYASNLNRNNPAQFPLTAIDSGTFITAP